MILDAPTVSRSEFERASGWALKPEGACRGDVCVPLPSLGDGGDDHGGDVDVATVAERLGMPLVHDESSGLWAVGPATLSGHVLPAAEAPDLELPDLDGRPFRLSSLRGQKVVLVAWAPY